jgi:hypothetical protein
LVQVLHGAAAREPDVLRQFRTGFGAGNNDADEGHETELFVL